MRAARAVGAVAIHVYSWESVIVSYDDEEKHFFPPDSSSSSEISSLLNEKLNGRKTIGLTGLSGYRHPIPFMIAKELKQTRFFYDVYDDFSYGAAGLHRLEKIKDDLCWRWSCNGAIVLSDGLKLWYPFSRYLDNASHCSFSRQTDDPTRFVYIGSIDSRVDFSWLRNLVKRDITLDIYGRVHASDMTIQSELQNFISENGNVRYLGEYENDNVEIILSNYSIGVIPYKTDNRMTKYVNPDKLYHYLNSGLEVLASPIPQVRKMREFIHIIDDESDWTIAISCLSKPRAKKWHRSRYNWEIRWQEMNRIYEQAKI